MRPLKMRGVRACCKNLYFLANKDHTNHTDDKTELRMLAANSSVDDVMLYDRLNDLANNSKGQLTLEWTVSKLENGQTWHHLVGRISKDLLQKTLPAPAGDVVICLCGPPGFNKVVNSLMSRHDGVFALVVPTYAQNCLAICDCA